MTKPTEPAQPDLPRPDLPRPDLPRRDSPLIVSACLAGVRCRHDGRSKPDPRIVELARQGRAVLVCPEQLGGLPTPREPANLITDPGTGPMPRVVTTSGADVTENFRRGAEETLRIAELTGARRAILKERSPSCGTGQVWQVAPADAGPRLAPGRGITARLLAERGLELFSEETWPPGAEDE